MDEETLHRDTGRQALVELRATLLAATLTLIGAVILFQMAPVWQKKLQQHANHPGYDRIFTLNGLGGTIRYRINKNAPESRKPTPGILRTDLEILSNRFKRGEFDIALIAGFHNTSLATEMKQQYRNYDYALQSTPDGAELRIRARTAASRRVLQTYLTYLRKRWHI